MDALVEKSGRFIGLDLDIEGSVTVTCDRCLGDLVLPVSVHPRFSVKFGQEPASAEGAPAEGDREIVFLPETDTEMDLSQLVYDYVCISLPMSRVHPEGECDPDTVKYLMTEPSDDEGEESGLKEETESPFAALKTLLDNK